MKDFCRNVTIKKKKTKLKLHYIPIIPLGISYSRLNNFIALHMTATVWLYWASSLQLREQGVIIVPRACMCPGPPETSAKENQQSRFSDAFIQVGMVYAALWWFVPGGCAMDWENRPWGEAYLDWCEIFYHCSVPWLHIVHLPRKKNFVIFCYKYKKYFILWHPSTLINLSGLYLQPVAYHFC